jgi:hypothetical protein
MDKINSKHISEILGHTDCPSIKKLISYKKDELPRSEMHEIEKHLIDCEICSDVLEGLCRVKDLQKMDSIVNSINEKVKRRIDRKQKSQNKIVKYIVISAACLSTFFIFNLFNSEKSIADRVFDTHFSLYPNLFPIQRGDDQNSLFIKGMQAYESSNLTEAKSYLTQVKKTEENYDIASFYLAVIYLKEDNLQQAKPLFQNTIDKKNEVLIIPSKWYLALTYLRLNEIELMNTVLQDLQNSNSIYSNPSKEILEQFGYLD